MWIGRPWGSAGGAPEVRRPEGALIGQTAADLITAYDETRSRDRPLAASGLIFHLAILSVIDDAGRPILILSRCIEYPKIPLAINFLDKVFARWERLGETARDCEGSRKDLSGPPGTSHEART